MTDGDWAAEAYRSGQRKEARRWWPVIVVGLVVLLATVCRLAAAVLDRVCR